MCKNEIFESSRMKNEFFQTSEIKTEFHAKFRNENNSLAKKRKKRKYGIFEI
jgi:hypothetical protein